MKVVLSIAKTKPVKYVIKAKDLKGAAKFMREKPYAACYNANPTFKMAFGNDGIVNQITLIAKPTVTMPSWSGASKLKGDDKKHWSKMIAALKKHEAKHHSIFETDAKAFKKKREKDGDVPKEEVDGIMYDMFSDSQDNQDKHDSKTDHGIKDGVVLPE